MADPYSPDPSSDSREQAGPTSDQGSAYRTPTWVKVFGLVALVLIVLLVVSLLLGVRHGPSLHGPSSAAAMVAT
jgi:hypothetical protein